MTQRTQIHGLQVATVLADFINQQVLPGTGVVTPPHIRGTTE